MILLILILGFGLRLISINQSLWLDEATSALTTKMNLRYFFEKFIPGDFHPPLYYLLLRIWSSFFGSSEIALRSLSIVFGVGTIYIVYLISKACANQNLVGKKIGLIAALLLATSGLHIYYSQEARMYSMSTFLVALLIYFFVKTLRERGVGNWVAFGITLGLIAMTDYLPLLVLPAIWIFAFLEKKDFYWWKKFIMSHIILAILGLLWLPVFLQQLHSGINVTNTSPAWVNVLGVFSIKDILLIPVKFMIGRVSFDNKFIYGIFVAGGSSLFGFLIYKARKNIKKAKLIGLWLTIPVVLALVISLKFPILNYFRFLFILPAFYLIAACGVDGLKKNIKLLFLFLIVGINLVTSFIYLTNVKFQREDWRAAVNFIEANRTKESEVIFPANSQMEAYRYYAPTSLITSPDQLKTGPLELWLMRYAQLISDPTDSTREKVEKLGYDKQSEYDFNGVTVWKYARSN
jgi:mannosyltransferase